MKITFRMMPAVAAILSALIAAACASSGGSAPVQGAPIWTGTPQAASTPEREIRYYRDSTGGTWDDRGRQVEARPAQPPLAPGPAPEGR